MAAFLDQCSAGSVEPVQFRPFPETGSGVDDREHANAAGRRLYKVEETLHRRHVAIFHRHPDRRGVCVAKGFDPWQVGRIGKKRLFDKIGSVTLAAISLSSRDMTMIGLAIRRQSRSRTASRSSMDATISESGAILAAAAAISASGSTIARAHARARQGDVSQMLLPHHPAADEAVSHTHEFPSSQPCLATNLDISGSNQVRENSTCLSCCDQPRLSTYPTGDPGANGK